MKNKFIKMALILLLLVNVLSGCSNNQNSGKDNTKINYSLTKLDIYSKLDLNIEDKEYIFINSVDNNKVYFTYEQFKDKEGTGRSQTLKIGEYDIKSGSVKFIKEFKSTIFVDDVTCNNNNEILYTCHDEQNRWYIKKIKNPEESIIDEGDSFTFMPKLLKNGNRVFYLYEKVNSVDGSLEYQYGVNEISGKGSLTETDKHKIRIKNRNEIIEKEGIIDEHFYFSKNAVAYVTHKANVPYVNFILLNTGERKNFKIEGKIHNINLLKNDLILSLEDNETGKIRLEAQNYNSNNLVKSDVNFPLYRMETNGNDKILAVDGSFNVFLLGVYNNIRLTKIDVKGQEQEPVLFKKVSDTEFLMHYGNQGSQKKELYLLSFM